MIRICVYPYQTLPSRAEMEAVLGGSVAATVGSGRRGKALLETLLGFCLLGKLLPDVRLDTLQRTEKGRPFLAGHPELDFSITHTGGLVGCAVELAEQPKIGLDAEALGGQTTDSMRRVAGRWFTPKEQATFAADPTAQTFLSLWTAKEAVAKWHGGGLGALPEQQDLPVLVRSYAVGNCILSAACCRGRELPERPEIIDLFPET